MIENIFTDDVIKLLIALLIGAIIGAEREYRSKAAGFRTVILVTVGSCLFTIISLMLGDGNNQGRIAANIVTGIGFLGAGAIYRDKISIRGLTTATTIWISAALGMAIGCGQFHLAFTVTTIVMVILLSFSWFQKIIDTVNQEKIYKFKLDNDTKHIVYLETLFHKYDLRCIRIKQERHADEITVIFKAEGKEKCHAVLIDALYQEATIRGFDV
jgi:putative Mg2+ transporter-C (MgtC) family protein